MVKAKKEIEVKKEERKSKKKISIIISVIILLLVAAFLFWWFNRKFEISFKYNNSAFEDSVVKVKYLKLIDKDDYKEDLIVNGKTFVGWFETYYLDGKDIEAIKKDIKLENTICKEGFKLDSTKVKCISEKEFDFETKIKKDTIIEALWSTISFSINPTSKTINVGESFKITASVSGTKDKTVTYVSSDKNIATVDSNGKVVGVKKGNAVITVTSNGINKKCNVTVKEVVKETPKEEPKKEEPKKDEGTISLRATDQCLIGSEEVKITATVNNALDNTITWNLPKCYTNEKVSDTVYNIKRTGRGTMCRSEEERTFSVTAKLNNGNSDSLKFTYEPALEVKVYNGNSLLGTLNNNGSGEYQGNNVNAKTNVVASFKSVNTWNKTQNTLKSSTDTSFVISGTSDSTATITTTCGQTAKFTVSAVIN